MGKNISKNLNLFHFQKSQNIMNSLVSLYISILSIILVKLSIRSILFYQKFLSPFKGKVCRYSPSCSQYTLEAISKYGFIKGWVLGIVRILRCNPFSKGGYDPVP